MLNHKVLKDLYYEQDLTMLQIASNFHVSVQRVQQIVKTYKSFSSNNFSFKHYPNLRLLRGCRKCGKRVQEIHHKDGDSYNNKEKNLIPLCRKCHVKTHKTKSVYVSEYTK